MYQIYLLVKRDYKYEYKQMWYAWIGTTTSISQSSLFKLDHLRISTLNLNNLISHANFWNTNSKFGLNFSNFFSLFQLSPLPWYKKLFHYFIDFNDTDTKTTLIPMYNSDRYTQTHGINSAINIDTR